MKSQSDCCIFNGRLIAAGTPVAPVTSRGLMYGDGIFETFRSYSGRSLLLAEHLDRLKTGLECLEINRPPGLEIKSVECMVRTLLQEKKLLERDAIVRLQVWREGSRGYIPDINSPSHFSIIATECPDTFSCPKIVTVNRRRVPEEALPSCYKLTNSINYILASREAEQKGGDDALMQTVDNWVSETTLGNIFWIKNETIFTPSKQCDLLPGITRKIVIELILQNDLWKIRQGKFLPDHVMNAESVFITNSVRELLAVKQVDKQYFDVGNHVYKTIRDRFINFRNAHLQTL
ncbi:MAG: aminotransferase class IV [Balneolaceae bacterium]|jgi:branched-subunit amino acid aminotransferase/4-amino-4-deoxychorismate lyase